ncbi:hypothetical protein LSUE1_G006973 [Lachnellula suecica]|uniref:Malate dehydrogenase n=1 Tax=Lachnellula suecica TaxID=602035 RepID=A0A8T9C2Z0_9HELO|nr:hypothetical protein LSUE1_G006973 [Lachnellula suecica]
MPSFSTILKSLALATVLNLASASPIELAPRAVPTTACKPVIKPTAAAPTVPASGNDPDLPTTDLALQYVAIGRGTQNYTCAGAGANSSATGAIATLYDVTSLAYANINMVNAMPPNVVTMPVPAPGSTLMTTAGPVPALGNHYFDAASTPTFNLSSAGKILYGKKSGDVLAPAGANAGPAGTGAVDWLQLVAKPAPYVSNGVSLVYRVETAGGMPPACTKAETLIVQYAAEYWFYN